MRPGSVRLPFFLFGRVFAGCGQHELDAVELVDFTGAGIVIDRSDVGHGVEASDVFDDTLAYDMVGKAAERLDTPVSLPMLTIGSAYLTSW